MSVKDILQGKWLHHPVHAAVVHLPLGLWLGACVLDILIRAGLDEPVFADLSACAVGLGLLGAAIAAPTGIADWSSIKRGKPAWTLGLYHMLLNIAATLVWAANLWLRLRTIDDADPVTLPVLVLSILGGLLLLVSGYLGSLLTFDRGVSVARLSKARWRAEAERGGARLPKKD
ncbi:hypothetical protein DB347_12350 [Opitutaceae bacterium EW11]|nr:hypothetical protein DB347_12350 [Opitutaceae bacterium EW11]